MTRTDTPFPAGRTGTGLAGAIGSRRSAASAVTRSLAKQHPAGSGASSCASAWPSRMLACARSWPPMAWAGRCRQGTRAPGRWCRPGTAWAARCQPRMKGGRWYSDPDEAQQARTCVFLSQAESGRPRPGTVISARQHARELSPLPPGQDPGPVASIRYREGQPRRGITSLMKTDDHVDRAMFMSSSGNPG